MQLMLPLLDEIAKRLIQARREANAEASWALEHLLTLYLEAHQQDRINYRARSVAP